MDNLDRRILSELQENFPLAANPYDIMAERLGIDVDALWQRTLALVESGVIRRLGFSIDSREIGYCSTLAAIRISAARVQEASELIAAYPEITHSYLRDDTFNIWFTVIAENRDRIASILERVRMKLGLSDDDLLDLPVQKMFKLDARFR